MNERSFSNPTPRPYATMSKCQILPMCHLDSLNHVNTVADTCQYDRDI